jgi:hypothetical protein
MTKMSRILNPILRISLLALFATVLLGCMTGDDGPVLSDDEKIKRANSGRADYARGMQGGGAGKPQETKTQGQ